METLNCITAQKGQEEDSLLELAIEILLNTNNK